MTSQNLLRRFSSFRTEGGFSGLAQISQGENQLPAGVSGPHPVAVVDDVQ